MSDDFLQSEPQNGAAPKQEKYNTQFIVANLQKDKQRTKLIVLGVIVAVVGAVSMLAIIGSGDDPTTRGAAAAHVTAPATPATAAATTQPAPAKPAQP